ncbi:hypothetical protein OQA88_2369 [Cercophora sp. LCS_1]
MAESPIREPMMVAGEPWRPFPRQDTRRSTASGSHKFSLDEIYADAKANGTEAQLPSRGPDCYRPGCGAESTLRWCRSDNPNDNANRLLYNCAKNHFVTWAHRLELFYNSNGNPCDDPEIDPESNDEAHNETTTVQPTETKTLSHQPRKQAASNTLACDNVAAPASSSKKRARSASPSPKAPDAPKQQPLTTREEKRRARTREEQHEAYIRQVTLHLLNNKRCIKDAGSAWTSLAEIYAKADETGELPELPDVGPPCRTCDRLSDLKWVPEDDPNPNSAGRPYHMCGACPYPHSWVTFADMVGTGFEKKCFCGKNARVTYTGKAAKRLGEGRPFWCCAEGMCDWRERP